MSYPTDPYTLANLAEWEWQELLARVAACSPLGRRKIIHVPQSLNKQYGTSEAEGWKNAAIARKLAVDPSLITRILKNER
jgi:hypothetical protein